MEVKLLETIRKYKGFLNIDCQKIQFPNGKVGERELMVKKNAVAAFVYNPSTERFFLVKQYRPGHQAEMLEIVAGTLNEGEDPDNAIRREIEEEIGYIADEILSLGSYYVSPGCTNEKMHLYLVNVTEKISNGGGLEEENEFIEVMQYGIEELEIIGDQIFDMKTMLAFTKVAFFALEASFNDEED